MWGMTEGDSELHYRDVSSYLCYLKSFYRKLDEVSLNQLTTGPYLGKESAQEPTPARGLFCKEIKENLGVTGCLMPNLKGRSWLKLRILKLINNILNVYRTQQEA